MFKAVKNRKCSGYADCHRSDRLTEICFLQTKATHFETMLTTVDEVNSNKTKVRDEFLFRSVLLVCFTAELNEYTDSQSMKASM